MSSIRATTDFEEQEDELCVQLLEICERAYANGITSADIYETLLHSDELFFSSTSTTPSSSSATTRNNNKSEKISKLLPENSSKLTYSHYFITNNRINNKIINNLNILNGGISKVFAITLLATIVLLLSHILISKAFHLNPLKLFPNLKEKRCFLPSHPLIMEMIRPIANCSICQSSSSSSNWGEELISSPVIELNEVPSKEYFKEIAYSSRPIIVRKGGGGGSSVGEPFTFSKLRDIFQSEIKGVETVSEECQFLPFRSPFTTLRDAFDQISDQATWTQPWYIGWSNCHPGVAAKLRKILPRPTFIPDDSESSAIDWIFIGSPGLGAAMHIDYVRRPSWQAQLSGIKTWHLRPPPECEGICPDSLTFTINPGDLLFLETNTWYHQTFIEGDTLSISVGSEYD